MFSPKGIIRGFQEIKGIDDENLLKRLHQYGYGLDISTWKALNAKINRNTFNATFFLQCLWVMGIKKIDLEMLGTSEHEN